MFERIFAGLAGEGPSPELMRHSPQTVEGCVGLLAANRSAPTAARSVPTNETTSDYCIFSDQKPAM